MNVRRFTAATTRDALKQVKALFGVDAVVLSTRTCEEGVEIVAMAPDALNQFEKVAAPAPALPVLKDKVQTEAGGERPSAARRLSQRLGLRAEAERQEPSLTGETSVEEDVNRLSMSTLSFQDYVRERMLKRRQEEQELQARREAEKAAERPRASVESFKDAVSRRQAQALAQSQAAQREVEPPLVADKPTTSAGKSGKGTAAPQDVVDKRLKQERQEMMTELRSMKGLIEERFGALAFMEKLQRQPAQAQLAHKLLECGFSSSLIRKMTPHLPEGSDGVSWASDILARNLLSADKEAALEEQGGVFALVGPTGVGKTTSTAKLAAAFAARHGANQLGLITLDAYRVGGMEQLRAYGRILGVPVHSAHDKASLEDLLELLSGKRMVLIDTAGMAQRDARTRELADMLSHPAIQRLLVVNACAQGETIEDVMRGYGASTCKGVILSKIDEAVKLGPALDALIRFKLKVIAVGNGQRVPEDWHRLSSRTLVQHALKYASSAAWQLDDEEVSLTLASAPSRDAMAAAWAQRGTSGAQHV